MAVLDAQAGEVLGGGAGHLTHAGQGGQGMAQALQKRFLLLNFQALVGLLALGDFANQNAGLLQQILGSQHDLAVGQVWQHLAAEFG